MLTTGMATGKRGPTECDGVGLGGVLCVKTSTRAWAIVRRDGASEVLSLCGHVGWRNYG